LWSRSTNCGGACFDDTGLICRLIVRFVVADNDRLARFAHELRRVIRSQTDFTGAAQGLPARKWPTAGTSPYGRATLAIGLVDTRLDAIEEGFDLLSDFAEDALGQAVLGDLFGNGHRCSFLNAAELGRAAERLPGTLERYR
jgi:hypothetical protein